MKYGGDPAQPTFNHQPRMFLCLWKSKICPHQLDVQEADISIPQFSESEIISLDAGLRMDGLPAFDLWDVVNRVLRSTKNTKRPIKLAPSKETCAWQATIHQLKRESERFGNCQMWTTYPQTHSLLKVSLSCTFFKITKLWSR